MLNKIAKSTAWYLVEKTTRIVVTFFVGLWVARYLGPVQYGTLSYAIALTATLSFFASWGLESLVVTDFIKTPHKANEITTTYFYMRFCGALVVPLVAVGYLLLVGLDQSVLIIVTLILSLSVICLSFDVADCYLQAEGLSARTSMVRVCSVILGALIKIAFIILEADLWMFAMAISLESLVLAFLYSKTLRNLSFSLKIQDIDPALFKQFFVGGAGLVLSAATVVLYSKIDILVIGGNFSGNVLGNYSIASSMCGAWNLLGISICQAFAPYITRSKHSEAVLDYQKTLRFFLLLMFGVAVLGSLILSFVAEPLFTLVLGNDYLLGAQYFQFLIWVSIPTFLGIATSQIIVNENQYWVSLFRTSMGLAITLAFIYPALNAYGVQGVIAVLLVSSCINTPLVLLSSQIRKVLLPAICWRL